MKITKRGEQTISEQKDMLWQMDVSGVVIFTVCLKINLSGGPGWLHWVGSPRIQIKH